MKVIRNISLLFVVAICACGNTKSVSEETLESTNVVTKVEKGVVEQGVVFLDINPEQAFERAKAEGKLVFVDFYTKTCGPCKKMKKEVFESSKCGEYINKRFVSIMLDGDDGGIGTEFAKKYQIQIYPSCLVLLPDGGKEGEIVGAEFEVDNFLNMLKLIMHDK